ncbi:3-oxoacyl-ACP synthase [Actinoplanes cyaneus]|uniref:3-oxoacyl-ACP synthase n=1 Tax=Actinoplanes cyaneus TaxID=52696 RepID=A0A919MAG1_9ACTN|nr:3-oxoacyl-[acyl-carrier-protein] synthase III C-terminal domain-containing protein [Actinoplanes cyaneus]MCW2138212.1 3-oxoacyl-[acyl-carrier-protein] synthase-3 [Actinoplanes cyaneus]GID70493.1 3-oxoacyl-ACP synthase [Actinoplanes cyaneus]
MTSIEAVAAYHPPVRTPVGDCLREYGLREAQISVYERFYGFRYVRLDPGGSLTEQLVAAMSALPELRGREDRIRYVMHARSMPVVAPYPVNPLLEACRKVGLEHAEIFSVSQHACASALLAVHLAGTMLATTGDPDARALVVGADKAFTASAQAVVAAGVMGESASAVLVRAGGDRDRVLGYATRTHGRYYQGPWMPDELGVEFQDHYPDALAEVIEAAVRSAGLGIDDIALILPHNVNRMSWMRVLRLLGIRGADRLYLVNQADIGHCFCSDSFLNHETARLTSRLRRGDHYVMTAVGLGATFSAMVLEH